MRCTGNSAVMLASRSMQLIGAELLAGHPVLAVRLAELRRRQVKRDRHPVGAGPVARHR